MESIWQSTVLALYGVGVLIVWLAALAPSYSFASFPPVQAQSQQAPLAATPGDFGLRIISNSPKNIGETVTFTATVNADAPPLTFIWDFGDGNTAPGGKVIQHTYTGAGVFKASAKATDGQGNTQMAETGVTIRRLPTPTPTSPPTVPNRPIASCTSPVMANNPTNCSASDPQGFNVTFTWDFGDGSDLVEGPSVNHSYTTTGPHTVTVRSRNSVGISEPAQVTVVVTEQPIGAVEIQVSGSTYIGSPVTFIATIDGGTNPQFQWTFGDGQVQFGPATIQHTYSNLGSYTVHVFVFNSLPGGSSADTSIKVGPRPPSNLQVFVSPQPFIPKVVFFASVEGDGPITFFWDFGDGHIERTTAERIEHTYAERDIYPVVVTAMNSSGMISTGVIAYADVTAPAHSVKIKPIPFPILLNQPILFSVEEVDENCEYQWDFGDGTSPQTGSEVLHTFTRISSQRANVTCMIHNPGVVSPSGLTNFVVATAGQAFFPVTMLLGHSPRSPPAETLFQESRALYEQGQDKQGLAYTLQGLGLLALEQGDTALAAEQLQESLALWQTWGDRHYIAASLAALGKLAQAQGDHGRALMKFRESLTLYKQMADKQGAAETLEWLAGSVDQADLAVRLFAAAHTLRQQIGTPVPPVERANYDRWINAARTQLGEQAFAAAWSDGRTLTHEQAIARALAVRN